MTRSKVLALLAGVAIAVAAYAQTSGGGFPSRPTFQLLTVRGSPGVVGNIRTQGIATGASNLAYVAFIDSAGTRTGYVGDGSGANSDITLAAETAAANLSLASGAGGQVTLNGVASSDFARLSSTNTFTALQRFNVAVPEIVFTETDASADNGRWSFHANVEQFRGSIYNDAEGVAANWVLIDRTGTTVDTVNLQATSVQANGAAIATSASGNYLAAITGCTTSPNATINWVRTGNIVTMTLPTTSCTSNATSLTWSGANSPAANRPANTTGAVVLCAHTNNSVQEYGITSVNVQTDGALWFIRNGSVTGFTAANLKGLSCTSEITYAVD